MKLSTTLIISLIFASASIINGERGASFINWDNPPMEMTLTVGAKLHFRSEKGLEHTVTMVEVPPGASIESGELNSEKKSFFTEINTPGEYLIQDDKTGKKMKLQIQNLYDPSIREEFKQVDQNGNEYIPENETERKAYEKQKEYLAKNPNANPNKYYSNPETKSNNAANNENAAAANTKSKNDAAAAAGTQTNAKAKSPAVTDTKAKTGSDEASSDSKVIPEAVADVTDTKADAEKNSSNVLSGASYLKIIASVCALSVAYLF